MTPMVSADLLTYFSGCYTVYHQIPSFHVCGKHSNILSDTFLHSSIEPSEEMRTHSSS